MPKVSQTKPLMMGPAKIIAVNEESRVVDIQWLNLPTTKKNVIVVGPPGHYSLPKVGDAGVVIGNGFVYYFMGNIEYGYREKVAGTMKDPMTDEAVPHKKVKAGEIHIANMIQQVWMNITEKGNFYLMNGLMEGFQYARSTRMVQILGKVVQLLGNGTTVSVGNAMRINNTVAPGVNGGKALEILMRIAYQNIQTVRLHLGDLTDLVTGLVPELGTWGSQLKAVLEVTAAAVVLAALKIDQLGNIELKSASGQVALDGAMVTLGGTVPPPTHPLVFGDLLLTWLNTHTHPSATGPTGPAQLTTPATAALTSLKVFTN